MMGRGVQRRGTNRKSLKLRGLQGSGSVPHTHLRAADLLALGGLLSGVSPRSEERKISS